MTKKKDEELYIEPWVKQALEKNNKRIDDLTFVCEQKNKTIKELNNEIRKLIFKKNIYVAILTIIASVVAIYLGIQIISHSENLFANGLSSCLNDGYSQVYCETHNVR